ncbi:P60-like protein [Wilcoxina mikolae CBS 423.85]|nr:P60-like protein [Wilcoxina mikolae CBS 423.85]
MSSKQPSRKGKKAWRKNANISDVQLALEQVREEIAQGGLVKEKPDNMLYSIDLAGDNTTESLLIKKLKPLKSDEILADRSAVSPVDTRKRAGGFITDGVVQKKKKRKDGMSFAQLQRLRVIANGAASSQPSGVLVSFNNFASDYDPWGDDAVDVLKKMADIEPYQLDFVEKKIPIKAPKTLLHKPVALTAIGLPAVRLPQAGISYNPEFEKWEALLREVGEKEVKIMKKRLAEEDGTARIQASTEAFDQRIETKKDEWEGVHEVVEEEEDQEEGEECDREKRKEVKRKSQAQKNKVFRRKEIERAREVQRKLKKQAREFMLVKKYTKEIKLKEKLRIERAIAKKAAVEDDEKNPKYMRKKRFGKVSLPHEPLELQLPDELSDSLRTLKPEGNLLSDRFHSLRERGIVEARTPITFAKQAKRSMTEKWSYKDFK